MRPVACWVKSKFLDPGREDSSVLARTQMRRVVDAARKQKVLGFQPCLLDPVLDGVARCLRDLELHRALGLVLQHYGATCHLVAVADVTDLETNQVASAQLAVGLKRASSRARPSIWRRTRSAQMSLSLNGAFWPTILPLFHGSR